MCVKGLKALRDLQKKLIYDTPSNTNFPGKLWLVIFDNDLPLIIIIIIIAT